MAERLAKKILLLGWDAADWKFLNPLIDKGLMPNLEKLIGQGVMGKLATLDPPLSPTLWTSISTGKRPYQHGIHGFTEKDPVGTGIRPINITQRKCKALWNILTQKGMKSHVVGWWPSHPAEPINGTMISNFYQRSKGNYGDPWPMLKGTVHPEEKSELYAKMRIHPQELTQNHLLPFIPNAGKIDQTKDKRIMSVAKVLADCTNIHAAATHIMEHEEWDLMAVYHDAIDHFCHGFMKYHPPHRPHIPMEDYEMYKDVVNSGCRYHDMMLGRMLDLAGEDTTVILISDHGFHPDHLRPKSIPKEPAGPAIEHSPYGIVCMKGPGIKKDALLFGSSLLDITPTILTLFGLPVGKDMDGRVLVNAFEEMPKIDTVDSWDTIAGDAGMHPEDYQSDPEAAKAELQQLIELGYIEDTGENDERAIKSTVDENNFNLARAYMDGQKYEEGIKILEDLHTANPKTLRFATYLASAYQNVGKYLDCRRVVDHIRSIQNRESADLDILEGSLFLIEQRYKKALELFQKAEREGGKRPLLNLRIGHAYMQMNKFKKAEKAFRAEAKVNPEEANVYHALGICYLRTMRYEEAAQSFLDAIGLLYHMPAAHYYLGETLLKLERYEDAANAFDITLKMAPGIQQARQALIKIYTSHIPDAKKAASYQLDWRDQMQGQITIVSGLPRSGTSMMMQMLEAAGVDIFTDGKRAPDESNPRGYYEHEAVKGLKRNKKWIPKARNKAVKVIANLVQHLPMNHYYKIVFMERDLMQLLSSQQKMLKRGGKKVKEDTLPIGLLESFKTTINNVRKWANTKPNVDILFVSHQEAIENPTKIAKQVNEFIGGEYDEGKMAAVVDRSLHRVQA